MASRHTAAEGDELRVPAPSTLEIEAAVLQHATAQILLEFVPYELGQLPSLLRHGRTEALWVAATVTRSTAGGTERYRAVLRRH